MQTLEPSLYVPYKFKTIFNCEKLLRKGETNKIAHTGPLHQ